MPTWTVDFHGSFTGPPIEPGDLVLGANLIYIVDAARPVESKIWPERWKVTLHRIARRDEMTREVVAEHLTEGARCHEMGAPYERGERPGDRRCDDPGCVGCR